MLNRIIMKSHSLTNLFIIVSLAIISIYKISCNNKEDLVTGGLYSVISGDGKYGIIKVLVLDTNIVHIRIYSNEFDNRPINLDTIKLYHGTIHDKNIGIGHLPIFNSDLQKWEPKLILKQPVTHEELEGYKIWKEAKGGVFGSP